VALLVSTGGVHALRPRLDGGDLPVTAALTLIACDDELAKHSLERPPSVVPGKAPQPPVQLMFTEPMTRVDRFDRLGRVVV
jgi:hypothetical protein